MMNPKTCFFHLVYALMFPHLQFSKRGIFKLLTRSWLTSEKTTALFLDFDGTLWADQGPGGILKYEGLQFVSLDNIDSSSLRKQSRFGISNQTLFAYESRMNFKAYFAYRRAVRKLINQFQFDAISICNHHPEAQNLYLRKNCPYRKPNPSSIISLARCFRISKLNSILVGDRITDIIAGNEAGIGRNLLVRNEKAFEKNRTGTYLIPKRNFAFQFIDNLDRIEATLFQGNISTLLLCAGKGTRLLPLTSKTPKPLLMLDGVTSILSRLVHQVSHFFPDSSIDINVSHLAETFVNHLPLVPFLDEIGFLWEEFPLGADETVRNVFALRGSSLLVISGDMLLSDSDIEIFKDSISRNPNTSVMACHYREASLARSRVVTNEHLITSFTEGPLVELFNEKQILVNSGIYFFAAKDLKLYVENKDVHNSDLTQGLLPFLIHRSLLSFHVWSDDRIAIDSQELLNRARVRIRELDFN